MPHLAENCHYQRSELGLRALVFDAFIHNGLDMLIVLCQDVFKERLEFRVLALGCQCQ